MFNYIIDSLSVTFNILQNITTCVTIVYIVRKFTKKQHNDSVIELPKVGLPIVELPKVVLPKVEPPINELHPKQLLYNKPKQVTLDESKLENNDQSKYVVHKKKVLPNITINSKDKKKESTNKLLTLKKMNSKELPTIKL